MLLYFKLLRCFHKETKFFVSCGLLTKKKHLLYGLITPCRLIAQFLYKTKNILKHLLKSCCCYSILCYAIVHDKTEFCVFHLNNIPPFSVIFC